MQTRVPLLLILALLVTACGAATPSPAPAVTSTPLATGPSESAASPTEAPTVTPSPAASVALSPTTATWTQIGAIDASAVETSGGAVDGLTAFDGGYVAWGHYGSSETELAFSTWYSPDGAAWEDRTVHSELVAPCPGFDERPNLDIFHSAATDGDTVVLVGSILDSPTREACDQMQLIALSTSDGTTWTRSLPFGNGWSESTWTAPDGFETRSTDGTVWGSGDGVTWDTVLEGEPDGLLDHPGGARFLVGGADAEGTRLGAHGPALLASSSAGRWREVYTLSEAVFAASIVPPAADGLPWLVALQGVGHTEPGCTADCPVIPPEASVLTSTDLSSWEVAPMPTGGIGSVLAMPDGGWVAVGYTPSDVVGCLDDCPTQDPDLYWSADGQDWAELVSSSQEALDAGVGVGSHLVLGPSGIIGLAPAGGTYPVWGLVLS